MSSSNAVSVSISSIVPTVGREHLRKSLESILTQDLEGIDHDVIVLNDSDAPLPDGLLPDDDRIRTTSTGKSRMGCGTVRNVGAVLATGRYLHFFDDDDLMLPGAFQAFRRTLEHHPDARWIHGCVERVTRSGDFIDRLPQTLEGNVLAALLSGEWFPLQASLVRSDLFFEAGGFDPRYPTSEDMDLMMRMSLRSDLVRVPELVFRYSEGMEESASPRSMDVEYLLEAHETIFDQPDALRRALASATSVYWRAQLVRNYLISVKRNARAGAYGKLGLRLLQAGQVVVRSGLDSLRPAFWRSVFAP